MGVLMEGIVLGIDPESREIAIKTLSGERYYSDAQEWKGPFPPDVGMKIDFDAQPGGQAKSIYPLGKTTAQSLSPRPPKSKTTATLFSFFLGGVGAHKFYLGSWGWGILYLVFCWTYIPLVLAIIETVRLITLKEEEFDEKYASLPGGAFDFLW